MMLSQNCLRIYSYNRSKARPLSFGELTLARDDSVYAAVDWATLSSTEYVILAVKMRKFICSCVRCVSASATTCVMRTRSNHIEKICCTFAVVGEKTTRKMQNALAMEVGSTIPRRHHRLVRTNWTVGVKVFI